MTEGNRHTGNRRRRYLFVETSGAAYAIATNRVSKVLHGASTHPVPGASGAFQGLLQHHGEPVVVLDLATLVGAGDDSGEAPLTILALVGGGADEERVALRVQEARTVDWIEDDALNHLGRGLISAETVIDGRVVRVLDLEALGRST